MASAVELYDGHYDQTGDVIYREIREETYGADLGQTSWICAEDCDTFASWLELGPASRLLDVACGAGGITAYFARKFRAQVAGTDVNPHAIAAARQWAAEKHRDGVRLEFRIADADQPLPFDDTSFDAIFCNDAVNHFCNRSATLKDWRRLLMPGGRILFTDPTVVTGQLHKEEIAVRSSIGHFVFTPPEINRRLIAEAGLQLVREENVTDCTARISKRWHDARQRRATALQNIEGAAIFDGVQQFLECVHLLSSEGRLSRFAYLAQSPK